MLRPLHMCVAITLLFPAKLQAIEKHDSNVNLAASKKGDFLYVVVLNAGEREARIGPMSYSATRNDLNIFGHRKEGLHLSNAVEMMSGKSEIEDWGIERYLRPGQFIGVVIPVAFLKGKYREAGCHEMMFAYRYNYSAGVTHSGKPKKLNVCW